MLSIALRYKPRTSEESPVPSRASITIPACCMLRRSLLPLRLIGDLNDAAPGLFEGFKVDQRIACDLAWIGKKKSRDAGAVQL